MIGDRRAALILMLILCSAWVSTGNLKIVKAHSADAHAPIRISEFPSWTPMLVMLVAVIALAIISKQKFRMYNCSVNGI